MTDQLPKNREFIDEARTLAQQLNDIESCRAHLQACIDWYAKTAEQLSKVNQLRQDLGRAAIQCYVARQRLEELEQQAEQQMAACRESEPKGKDSR